MIKLYKKYEEVIMYLIMGALTTIVNIVSYYIFTRLFKIDYQVSNVMSWVVAVLFAFITNKIYVFKSKGDIKSEFIEFIKYRVGTLVLEVILFKVMLDMLNINDLIVKIVINIIVIVLNYIFSKLFIFKEKK
jgi:putative flippase GtrA